MVDNPTDTPEGGKDNNAPTSEPKDEGETQKTFTQDELNQIVKDRIKREREKFKDYDDLKAAKSELDKIAASKLSDQEKAEARFKALEKALEEKSKAIQERDIRDLKRSKVEEMLSEKKIKLPDGVSISDVLDLVNGQDEDGITEGLGKLQKLFPMPKGVGGGSQHEPDKPNKTIQEEVADINKKMFDPAIPVQVKTQLAERLITLNNQLLPKRQ